MVKRALERDFQTRADTTRRRNRRAGKKAGEIQDIYAVGQVVRLQLHGNVLPFLVIERGAGRCIDRKIWPHTSGGEIHLVQDRRTVLREEKTGVDGPR